MKIIKNIFCLAALTLTLVQASGDGMEPLPKGSSVGINSSRGKKKTKYPYKGPYRGPDKAPKCGGKFDACCESAPFCKPFLGCDFGPHDKKDYGYGKDYGYAGNYGYGNQYGYNAYPKCVPCGSIDYPCCQSTCGGDEQCANTCQAGATCNIFTNKCEECGDEYEACCDDDKCKFGNTCNHFTGKCEKCGTQDFQCCDGSECEDGTVCSDMNICEECGGDEAAQYPQPCCEGGCCKSGFVCNKIANECLKCGGTAPMDLAERFLSTPAPGNEPCCENDACNPGFVCDIASQQCIPCGGDMQPCCTGERCDDGVCVEGTCTTDCKFPKNGQANSEQCTKNSECCKGCCNEKQSGSTTWCTGNKDTQCPSDGGMGCDNGIGPCPAPTERV